VRAEAAETPAVRKLGKTEAPAKAEGKTPAANSSTQTAQEKTASETKLAKEPWLAAAIAVIAAAAAVVVLVEDEAGAARERSQRSVWGLNRRDSADRACRRRWGTRRARGRWGTAGEEITERGV